jgi:hypothetical protein
VGLTAIVSGNHSTNNIGFVEIKGTLNIADNGKMEMLNSIYIVSASGRVFADDSSDQVRINTVTYEGTNATNFADGLTGKTGSLTVKLNYFESKISYGKVLLNWKTSEEVAFLKFEIESSSSAQIFERIGNINSGNSSCY